MPAVALGDQRSLMRAALDVFGRRETTAVVAKDRGESEGHWGAVSRLHTTT